MYSLLLLLLVLVVSSGCNAEVTGTAQIINFDMGGSQTTFSLDGLSTDEIEQIKCVVESHDGSDSIEIQPSIPRDARSAICRLTPETSAGGVDVKLVIATASANTSIAAAIDAQTLFVNPVPESKLTVVENWDANQLTLTWDVDYFAQFFNPGAMFLMQVTVYVANNFEGNFVASQIIQATGQNTGATTLTISAVNVARFSNIRFPYYYVLRAVGTNSDIFAASIIFAPTVGMNEAIAAQTCSSWLNSATVPTPPQEIHPCPPCLCQAELDANFVQSEYPSQIVELVNGALNGHVLYYEQVPTQSGYAQSCSYDSSTRNLATTSPAQASWINFLSKHISYVDNYFSDVWPYIVCCLQTNSQEYCDLFHEKRPIDTGHEYEGVENPCNGWGDPHMTTFDSVKYDFMGYGEFWLIRGPEGSEFGVQGRMAPNAIGQQVSFYKAVAIRDGNTTVQITPQPNANLQVLLNGRELRFTNLPVSLPLKSVFLNINANRVNVRTRSGFSIIVEDRAGGIYLDVFGSAAKFNKGKGFMGIFGKFDDDPNNDLTSQDGFVIPPTPEGLRDLSSIHHIFGMSWLVDRTESDFVYEDGKSWDDFVNIDFGPIAQYPDPATLPEEVRAACGDSLFCLYEYVGTGSLERAAEVARSEIAFDELREEMQRIIPICDTLNRPANGRVQVNGHLDGSVATYSCNREYDFESGDRVRTCSASTDLTQWSGVEPVCIWTCTSCLESMEFELTHDPSDCSKFFLCSFGERFLLDCPIGQSFDPELQFCSSDHNCRYPPGC